LGQLGDRCWVALSIDEGRQHRPAGDTHDVGRYRGQLDPTVFQDLLDPLHLPPASNPITLRQVSARSAGCNASAASSSAVISSGV